MKIVFYNKTLISGGIEKCIEMLSKYIYKEHELEVVYTDDSILDDNIVSILKQYANVHKIDNNQIINCDLCIWCYLYFDYAQLKNIIRAKKYIAWIHSMPRILPNCLLDNKDFINDCFKFICVSNAVKNNLNISKPGEVIHNFIDTSKKIETNNYNPFENVPHDYLKLAVVSRLSSGKGFDRLFNLCNHLIKKEINFKVLIIGKGRSREFEIKNTFEPIKQVEFVGYKENPFPYIRYADYLVQLSDDESWCNSITESKLLGTPVIVTDFESSKEQIENNINGIIIPLTETNYSKYIEIIINQKEILRNNLKDFVYSNEIDKWLEILNNIT